MKTHKGAIVIERLDERRYAVTVDGIVRFVGTQEECQQRAAMLIQKKDRPTETKHWRDRSGCCAESGVSSLEFSPKLGHPSRSLTSAALLLFPALSACGEDRLPLSGFRRFSLRVLGKPSCF